MNAPGELDNLIHAFLDDTLDAAEAARLKRLLETDPAAMRRFVRLLNIHVALPAVARAEDGQAGPAARARKRAAASGRRLRLVPFTLAAAAIALLAVGLFLLQQRRSPVFGPEVFAQVLSIAGEQQATLARDGRTVPMEPGTALQPGDRIRIAQPGSVRLAYARHAMTVRLSHRADLTLTDPQQAILTEGRAEIETAKRGRGEPPLRFVTPCAHVEIVGTRLVLYAGPSSARVRVLDGTVAVMNTDGENRTMIGPDMVAWALQGDPQIRRKPYEPGMTVEGRVLFADNFENGLDRWRPVRYDQVSHQFLPLGDDAPEIALWRTVSRDGKEIGAMELIAYSFEQDADTPPPQTALVGVGGGDFRYEDVRARTLKMLPEGVPPVSDGIRIEALLRISTPNTTLQPCIFLVKDNIATLPRDTKRRPATIRMDRWFSMRIEYAQTLVPDASWTHRMNVWRGGVQESVFLMEEMYPALVAFSLSEGQSILVANVVVTELLSFD